jgi:dolichol-phosphate mannosyltransferase
VAHVAHARPAVQGDGASRPGGGPGDRPRLTVLVPTRNEVDNVVPLLDRLVPAVAPLSAEIIFVDDSDDGTPEAVLGQQDRYAVPVLLVHREPADRRNGLSGALVLGARQARGDWVLVLDGDLQHPPETAAALAATAMGYETDIVVGTRYARDGGRDGLSGGRVFASSAASRLAKALFPRRLATVTDPMSGLFVFRRAAVDLDRLNPVGFKMLLELLVRNPSARVAEVVYDFEPRRAGTSKASAHEGLLFLRHLVRLRRERLVRQLRQRPPSAAERARELWRMVAFGAVGLTGIGVNTGALWMFHHGLGLHHLLGAALATQLSTTWNFALVELLVYRRRGNGSVKGRAVRFFLMNNLLLLARLPVLEILVRLGMDLLVANAVTLVLLFLVRFLVSDRVIYGSTSSQDQGRGPVRLLVDLGAPARPPLSPRKRSTYLAYRYDIAGTVTVGSQMPLPELEFFRAQWVSDADVDIAVRVGDVGHRAPRRRAAMTEYRHPATVRYEEHLGSLGANFRVELGPPVTIEVGPLLARSPHVVYTNILEALLRFVMVSRGRMLLHSACLSLDGVGVMLSALTDTGKTATVLRLVREHDARFLSDDMTVVDATGTAYCFPKPLTISAHTLRAVHATQLTRPEWRRLQLQSRLHSKGGRAFALALSRLNVPIMGINALTQILVPPPKYTVDRLVTCRMTSATRVEELFVIERGAPRVSELDTGTALERLLANTEDAYEFPPFRYLAPAITLDGLGPAELRRREREILAGFLSRVRCRVVASDDFGWADRIPELLGTRAATPAGEAQTGSGEGDRWPRWGGEHLQPSRGIA